MTYSMVMSTFNSSPASATPTSASHSSASGAENGAKHHFINQANHVCSLANKKQQKLAKPKSQAGLAIYANKSAQIFDSAMDQIRALNAPREDHIILRKWFDTTDAAIAATRKLSNEVSAGASVGVIHRAGAHIAALGDKSNAYATSYGLTVCADS